MSALIRFFGGNYQLYFVVLMLIALLTVSSGYSYQRAEKIELQAKVSLLNTELTDAKTALEVNAKAVTELQAGLDEWKGKAEAADAREAEALTRLDQQVALAAETNLKLQTTEKADNARPDCKKLLSMDVGALCPGHVAAMRVRARNPNRLQGPSRSGAGPHTGSP